MVDTIATPTTQAEPTYAGTVEDLGWSPDQLRPPFDLAVAIDLSYQHVAMLERHHDREGRPGPPPGLSSHGGNVVDDDG